MLLLRNSARGHVALLGILSALALLVTAAPAMAAGRHVAATSHVRAHRVATVARAATAPAVHPALRPRNAQAYAAAKARANQAYAAWSSANLSNSAAPLGSAPASMSSIVSLNKPGLTWDSGNTCNCSPPDTTGAIGPNYYIEMVNSEVGVYSRSTLASPPVATADESTFTGGNNTCDGQMKWDQAAHRYLFSSIDCGATNGYSFGWSKTANPLPLTGASSAWCTFHVSTGTNLEDYDKLGNSNTFLIIGANEFINNGTSYSTSPVFVVPMPANGSTTCPSSPTVTRFNPGTGFTPEPANIYGSSTSGYVVSTFDATHLRLYTVAGTASAPTLTDNGSITVPAYSTPASATQPGTSDRLDTLDTRLTQATAAVDPTLGKMAVWTQHTIQGPAGSPSVVRWYEINPATVSTVQVGTVSSPGNFVFNGAIAPDAHGDSAGLTYDVSGPSQLPAVHAGDHPAGSAAGTSADDVTLATSSAPDEDFTCSPCRWGDYAGASTDPSGCGVGVWGTNELTGSLATNPAWQTENFGLAVDECPTASFTFTPSAPAHGSPVTFDGSGSSDPDGSITSYSWMFGDGTKSTVTTPTTQHTYAAAGTYKVTLTVTDSSGLKATVFKKVTVS